MTSIYKQLDSLEALKIPEVREIFLETMQGIVDDAILSEIIKAVEKNDVDAVMRAIGFNQAKLNPIIDAIEDAYKKAGVTIGASYPTLIMPDLSKLVFVFDVRNVRAEQYLREKSSSLITLLTDEARENVRITLEKGLIQGNNPKSTALDIVGRVDPVTKKRIGGIIGLTNTQEVWQSNTRKSLENLDKKYFNKTLRDKRFDSIVKKAIKENKPLPKDTIDKIVTSYKNKALKYRADVISRTEVIQAINAADWESHKQLIETGSKITENDVKRFWDSSNDQRVRWSHARMDIKYEKNGIGINEPFESPTGARMMFPGDSSLGADGNETIQCRCRVKIKVDWSAMLED